MLSSALISVILTLFVPVFPGARDTVEVCRCCDSTMVCASTDSCMICTVADSTQVAAVVDSAQVAAVAADTLQVVAIADSIQVATADSIRVSVPADSTQVTAAADSVFSYARPDATQEGVTQECIRVPVVAISTNIPYDITWVPGYGLTSIPSFSLEYYPAKWKHFTIGADVEWPMWKHWDTHRFFQINNITLWTRRYFPERKDLEKRPQGLYLFGNVNAARYGIGLDANRGWQGEGIGVSLGVGYKFGLGKSRFFIDTGIAVGYFYSRYDPYVYGNDITGWYYYDYTGDPAEFMFRRKEFHWFYPTRIYVSIGFDFCRKKEQ